MKRLKIRISLALFWIIFTMACQLLSQTNTAQNNEDVFNTYLNLTPSKNDVRNISLEEMGTGSIITTSVYIRYLGNESFVATLLSHDSFLELSELNSQFRQIDCDSSQFPKEFSFWTDSTIVTRNKSCYIGLFFPYIHYIIRNPSSDEVDHFITGIRD